MNNLVSIIMPTYNRGKLIKRAVNSVLNQTHKNIELIVVDDGSTDNTKEVIKGINDNRIKYYSYKNNKGACYARNLGIKKAKGDYITFLDSDDEYLDNKVAVQLDAIIKSKSDINFCKFSSHNVNDELGIEIPSKDKIKEFTTNGIYNTLFRGNFISTEAIFAKREVFNSELYDEELPRLQDFDLVLRLLKNFKCEFVNENLFSQYIQRDSISSNPTKLFACINLILCKNYGENNSQRKDLVLYLLNIYKNDIEVLYKNENVSIIAENNRLENEMLILKEGNRNLTEENEMLKKENNDLKIIGEDYIKIINSKRYKLMTKILKIFRK